MVVMRWSRGGVLPTGLPGRRSARRSRALLVMSALCALLAVLAVSGTASAAGVPVFNRAFDGSGTPARSMTSGKVAVDESNGDVYVIDRANDVINRFDRDGTYISQIPGTVTAGRTFGFSDFDDLAVDNSGGATQGNLYLAAEQGSPGTLFAFDRTGRLLWERGGFADLCGVGVTTRGVPYAGDYGGGVTERSAADGSAVRTVVDSSTIGDSCSLAFDSSDNLYIRRFDDGQIAKFTAPNYSGAGTQFAPPAATAQDVEVDRSVDQVYVTSTFIVQAYSSAGTELTGSPFNSGSGTRAYAGGTPNSRGGRLYVGNGGDRNVEMFDPVQPVLTVAKAGAGSGTVRSGDSRIDCGSTCTARYDADTVVTLTATADSGSVLTGWVVTGDPNTTCRTTTNPCSVRMSADVRVTATFARTARLTVDVDPDEGGTVTSDVGGIRCNPTCTSTAQVSGTRITLTATPATNWAFAGWSGGGCSGTARCVVTLASDTTVTARFTRIQHTVTVAKSGTGSGSVSSSPAGITCGATCAALFDQGSSVTLTATADSGSTFAGWSGGGCSGTGTCTVTVAAATSVTAQFTANPVDQCVVNPASCQPPPPGVLSLASSTASVARGKAAVKLSCRGDTACTGSLTLTARITTRRGRRRVTRTVTVGRASYNVSANGSATVNVSLSGTAKSVLARKGRLAAKLTAGDLRDKSVTLKGGRARARRNRRGRRSRR